MIYLLYSVNKYKEPYSKINQEPKKKNTRASTSTGSYKEMYKEQQIVARNEELFGNLGTMNKSLFTNHTH